MLEMRLKVGVSRENSQETDGDSRDNRVGGTYARLCGMEPLPDHHSFFATIKAGNSFVSLELKGTEASLSPFRAPSWLPMTMMLCVSQLGEGRVL